MYAYKASYDLEWNPSEPHSPFKRNAEAEGWSSWTQTESRETVHLPNTDLTGQFASLAEADMAFRRALDATSRELGTPVICPNYHVVPQAGPGIIRSNRRIPAASPLGLLGGVAPPATQSLANLFLRSAG